MPQWLLQEDNYMPKKDKDAFINKNILGILQIISKFRLQTERKANRFRINSVIKFILTLIIIAFVSITRSFTYVLITNVFLLVIINFLSINEIKYILKISLVMGAFTFVILLPSILLGFGNNAFMITFKVLASVATVNILACTTQWQELIVAFKAFHIPDMFIFVLDISLKYILILGEFSLNMVYSLKLRSVGKSNSKSSSLSGIIGTMFIKSKEMAEEMHSAMECRGFTGEYKYSATHVTSDKLK